VRSSDCRVSTTNSAPRRVYRWLGESGVDTHVYGVDDNPTAVADLGVTVHACDDEECRRNWVVVFAPPDGEGDDHAALVAVETESNVRRGVWTYDPDRVRRVDAYLRQDF